MIATLFLTIYNCTSTQDEPDLLSSSKDISNKSEVRVSRPLQPMILGNKLENPFSVENMTKALNMIKSDKESARSAGITPDMLEDIIIKTTDLYVRFLPKDSADYHIIFDGQNDQNKWTFSKTLFGALCLSTSWYDAGYHSPNGYSVIFSNSADCWGRCVLNNAVYDYINYAKRDGIALPPQNLDIASKQSDNFTSSAPLLKNHFNFSLLYGFGPIGAAAEICGYTLFGWGLPDLILRYNKDMNRYNEMNAIVWHELTHASHLTRMTNERGYLWASNYWSKNVYKQASNEINNGDPYGSKGAIFWEIIALSEGWANFREQYLARKYLNQPYYIGTSNIFLFPFMNMFQELDTIGCTHTNLEKAICADSIHVFASRLIALYPEKQTQILKIIEKYA